MLPIIDKQVFKLQDPRVIALKTGKLSVTAFIHSLLSTDWFLCTGQYVYALTEYQYYALCSKHKQYRHLTKQQFRQIIQDTSWADNKDVSQLNKIKRLSAICTTCQYNRYRDRVEQIITQYPDISNKYNLLISDPSIPEYPTVTSTVIPKISKIYKNLFKVTKYDRKPCFECVRKHIGQAYIKGHQAQQGYDSHFTLAISNLAQAYEECPVEAQALRDLLLFCIGKSEKQEKIFIPLNNICLMLDSYISNTQDNDIALDKNKLSEDLQLDLSQTDINSLKALPKALKIILKTELKKAYKLAYTQNIDNDETAKVLWAGYLANAADYIIDINSQIASVLRNRRLLFKQLPSACCNSDYDCSDIINILEDTIQNQTATAQ